MLQLALRIKELNRTAINTYLSRYNYPNKEKEKESPVITYIPMAFDTSNRISRTAWWLVGGTGRPPTEENLLRMTSERKAAHREEVEHDKEKKKALAEFEKKWGRGGLAGLASTALGTNKRKKLNRDELMKKYGPERFKKDDIATVSTDSSSSGSSSGDAGSTAGADGDRTEDDDNDDDDDAADEAAEDAAEEAADEAAGDAAGDAADDAADVDRVSSSPSTIDYSVPEADPSSHSNNNSSSRRTFPRRVTFRL